MESLHGLEECFPWIRDAAERKHEKSKRFLFVREQRIKRKVFATENNSTVCDSEPFMKEKEEMMMMKKAYIREKAGIQRMSDALQLEKQRTEKKVRERKLSVPKRKLLVRGKCM